MIRCRACAGIALMGAMFAVAGCGSSSRVPGASTTGSTTAVTGLAGCLRQHAGATSVASIPPSLPGGRPGLARPSLAVGFQTGGPRNVHGTLIEAPVNSLQLYVFSDSATARRAAVVAEPAVARAAVLQAQRARHEGNRTAIAGVSRVTPIGRTVLVYVAGTAFGSGQQISAAEIAAVRGCLTGSGLT